MHSLPLFLRLQDRPVILLGEGEAAEAKARLLRRAGARITADEGAQAALAIVAIADEGQALAAIARLKARGVLVNAVDRPEHCDFTLPAIIDRDPVLIAVGTGGASAGLAKTIRQRLEQLLPPGLGGLAQALASARAAMKEHWPAPAERRRAIDAALAEGGSLDPFVEQDTEAVKRWLDSAAEGQVDRFEEILVTSPDADEMTLRTARLLGQADTIYHSPAIPESILNRARTDAVRVPVTNRPERPRPGLSLYLRWEG